MINPPYTCGPGYPVPPFHQQVMFWPIENYGIFYSNNIHAWYIDNNEAHIFNLGLTDFEEVVVPGLADNLPFNYQLAFAYNGQYFIAGSAGLTNDQGESWFFADGEHRIVFSSLISNGDLWLLTVKMTDQQVQLVRFDGVSTTIYPTSLSYTSTRAPVMFDFGNEILLQADLSFRQFNKATGNNTNLTYIMEPGFVLQYVFMIATYEDKLFVIGKDSLQEEKVQVYSNSTWSNPVDIELELYFGEAPYLIVQNATLVISTGILLEQAIYQFDGSGYSFVTGHGQSMIYREASYARSPSGLLYLLGHESEGPFCNLPFGTYIYLCLTGNEISSASGVTFFDENQNNIFDGNDHPVSVTVCSDAGSCAMSSAAGNYLLWLHENSSTVAPLSIPNYIVTPAAYSLSTPDSVYGDLDFAFQPTAAVEDLSVSSLFSYQPVRPGFAVTYQLKTFNPGTLTVNDTVFFTYDSLFTFNSAVPAPSFQAGNTLAWLLPSFNPLTTEVINVNFTVNALASLGSSVTNVALVNAPADANPSNDVFSLTQIVQGSYDPNDKAANPPYWANYDEDIQYIVRFQNTGTDTAFTVVIRDTLDANLDWSSFVLRHASHNVQVNLNLQNGALAFSFPNILLPDSNINEPASHGNLVYDIKTKNGLADGTFIYNTAHIYLDFNEAVVTNTTVNEIGEPSSVRDFSGSYRMMLVPNPAGHNVTLQHNAPHATGFAVTDVLGREVMRGDAGANNAVVITVAHLPAGTYLVSLFNESNVPIGRAKLAIVH